MFGQEHQRTLNGETATKLQPTLHNIVIKIIAVYIESKTGQNFCDDDPQVWHGHVHRHLHFLCIGILNVCNLCCCFFFVYV